MHQRDSFMVLSRLAVSRSITSLGLVFRHDYYYCTCCCCFLRARVWLSLCFAMEAGIKIQNRHRVAAAAENFETRLTADAAETATTAAKLSSARATALRSWEQRRGATRGRTTEKLQSNKRVHHTQCRLSSLLSVTFYNWFSDMGSILVSTLNINKLQCVNKRSKQFKPIFQPFYWPQNWLHFGPTFNELYPIFQALLIYNELQIVLTFLHTAIWGQN